MTVGLNINKVYKNYYNKRTIESFKYLLEEYFTSIDIVKDVIVDEKVLNQKIIHKKDLKEAKKEAIEKLSKHKNILVGYEEIKKDKRSYALMDYQSINNISIEQCKKDYLKHNIHNLILDNNLKSLISLYSDYVLKNNYSNDIAWKLANMGNRKRGNVFRKINNLVYRELNKEYPNIFANQTNVENRMYEWLINEFKVGTSYTNEHLEIVAEAFKIRYGENWAITTNKIGEILNQTYNIENKNTRSGTVLELSFYKNINPNGVPNKKIRVYTINNFIEIQDIKKELGCTSSDFTIEKSINIKKQYILNQLDETEKEILLEGFFYYS